jgi:hypothetical protein
MLTYGKPNEVAILATLQVDGASPFVAAVTHLLAAKTVERERKRERERAREALSLSLSLQLPHPSSL